MTMERRKIGEVSISTDGLSNPNKKIIWSNVWNYDNKIWFSIFFTLDILSGKDRKAFEKYGFKTHHNISTYGSYYKVYMVRPHDNIQEWLDTVDGIKISVDHTSTSGVMTTTYSIDIKKDAQYVFNEKIVDAL